MEFRKAVGVFPANAGGTVVEVSSITPQNVSSAGFFYFSFQGGCFYEEGLRVGRGVKGRGSSER